MKRIVLIDDDIALTNVLTRRFENTGQFSVTTFPSASKALELPSEPVFAVLLDMMMDDELGLDFIALLVSHYQPQHLIMMTGYASIATTVSAMKRGATDYVAKPVSFNQLLELLGTESSDVAVNQQAIKPLTPSQAEWEHIQRVLVANNHNVSKTADALGMHRRTLQRKLKKFSPTRQ